MLSWGESSLARLKCDQTRCAAVRGGMTRGSQSSAACCQKNFTFEKEEFGLCRILEYEIRDESHAGENGKCQA